MLAVATDTELANMALAHLGADNEISQLATDKSPAARVMRLFYRPSLLATFRDFPWGFASRFAALGLVAEQPTSEWKYSYRRPADCLFTRRILSGVRNETLKTRVPFREMSDAVGSLILTDKASAELEYTTFVDNVAFYPADFVTAASLRLAAYAAPRLTSGDKGQLGVRAFNLYAQHIAIARANSANEAAPDEPAMNEYTASRGA